MARGSLIQGFKVLTSEEIAYQTDTQLVKTRIDKVDFVHTGGSMVTLNVWITPDGVTPTSDELKVINSLQIGVNETYTSIELIGQYVNVGGKIIVQADVLGLSVWINGNTFRTEV